MPIHLTGGTAGPAPYNVDDDADRSAYSDDLDEFSGATCGAGNKSTSLNAVQEDKDAEQSELFGRVPTGTRTSRTVL